jgi:di/tricarboxylate transporter
VSLCPLLRHRFPWDICFLLGGGFAISLGFKDSGLSIWIADRLQGITDLPPVAIVALLCAGTAAFTEFNSNVASASILLPLVGRLAVTSGQNPLLFMMPVTLATSFAFCLPIATAPNAIAFGTGCMTVADMIKVCRPLPQQCAVRCLIDVQVGLAANALGLAVLLLFTVLLGGSTFDMFSGVPAWAAGAGR